jgi:hypothetical protein
LGSSLSERKRYLKELQTAGFHYLIQQTEARMLKNREWPRGKIHDEAVAEVAAHVGKSFEAMEKQFQRYKRFRPSKRKVKFTKAGKIEFLGSSFLKIVKKRP